MPIFKITSYFELNTQPDWLDEFRSRYDQPLPYHLTFKYHTYFEPDQLETIKNQLSDLTAAQSCFDLSFTEYKFDSLPKGNLIMVTSRPTPEIIKFHRQLISNFSQFGQLTQPYYQSFEQEFLPHITIARRLSDTQMSQAKSELKYPIFCQATIDSVSLTIFSNSSSASTSLEDQPHQDFLYQLKK